MGKIIAYFQDTLIFRMQAVVYFDSLVVDSALFFFFFVFLKTVWIGSLQRWDAT